MTNPKLMAMASRRKRLFSTIPPAGHGLESVAGGVGEDVVGDHAAGVGGVEVAIVVVDVGAGEGNRLAPAVVVEDVAVECDVGDAGGVEAFGLGAAPRLGGIGDPGVGDDVLFEGEVADRAEARAGAVLDGDVIDVVLERAVLDEHVVGRADTEVAILSAGQARVEGAVGRVAVLVFKGNPHQIDIVDASSNDFGGEDGG